MKQTDTIWVLETNIDDCSGEVLGYTLERLLENGARDAFYRPIYMKKNRPAYQLTVLCKQEDVDHLEDIIFSETTSIGIRRRQEIRTILDRSFRKLQTPFGEMDVKVVEVDGQMRAYPEYDTAKKLAKEQRVPLRVIYDACTKAVQS